jgi:4-carboxymuconolactone decarboxylase
MFVRGPRPARERKQSHPTMNDDLFETGLAIRREVLGADYVDASLANADDFTRDFQRLLAEYC